MNHQSNNSFFEKVYEIVQLIPYGRVTTYGTIAMCIGSPSASRMVGWAMNACHKHSDYIPAHRVVNRNGLLTGKHHFHSNTMMQELLENERIMVVDDKVQNFEKVFWKPE